MEFQGVYVGHVNRELARSPYPSFVMRETGTMRERRRTHLFECAQWLSDLVTLDLFQKFGITVFYQST